MNIYTQYKNQYTSGSGDSLFTDLQPDSTVRLRIMSDAYWNLSEYKDQDTGEVTHSDKYAWVVWNYDTQKAEILNKGISIFNQVADLAADEDWGDPQDYDIKITRTGKGLDTRYAVVPGKQSAATDAMDKAASEIDITKILKGAQPIGERLLEDKVKETMFDE